jgi:hypothetical protein
MGLSQCVESLSMKKTIAIGVFSIPLLVGGSALTTAQENAAPQGAKKTVQATQHMQHRRGPKQYTLAGADGAQITLWKPDLSQIPMTAKMGVITLPSTGMDNYHAIVAIKDWGDSQEAVVRYEYLRGKPSGQSPSRLTKAQKAKFEVVPKPIPRGHYHYYSDQKWDFTIRFGDRPLANHPVSLETAHGTRLSGQTDSKGDVTFLLPDDFPNVVEGVRDRRQADFAVMAEYTENGITYQSMLSAEYRINQTHWKSEPLGWLVGGLGLIVGGFLGRTKNNKGARK